MEQLTPQEAIDLAIEIYDIHDERGLQLFLANDLFCSKGGKSHKNFPINHANKNRLLTAESGGRLLKAEYNFGICARGGDGVYKQDLFIIFRGTDKALDWLTDARGTWTTSAVGNKVHRGFSDTFNCLVDDIKSFLDGKTFRQVHCIGHSLGGAVANLTALWIKDNGYCNNVVLYTFGSPRVGLIDFASRVTNKVGAENIHRVYHDNDFVSMVGPYPYCHAPLYDPGHKLFWPGVNVSFVAHSSLNYAKSLKKHSWQSLAEQPDCNIQLAQQWLMDDSIQKGSLSISSTRVQQLLNFSIQYVINLAYKQGVPIVLTGATVADHLSYIIYHGVKSILDIGIWALRLVRRIAQILGVPGVDTLDAKEMTYNYIRYLFQEYMRRINEIVTKSIMHAAG